MQNLPTNGLFITTGPRPNMGTMAQAWEDVRDFASQLFGAAPETILTLVSDVATPTQASHVIAAETGTADNLAQLGTTGVVDGTVVRIRPDTGDTITVKHNSGTVGKILLSDSADFAMGAVSMGLWLAYSASAQTWTEIDRSYGNNKSAFIAWLSANLATLASGLTSAGSALATAASASAQRTALGLGTAAVLNTGTTANLVVKLDGSARLPAVDGSQLTNLPSAGVPTGSIIDFAGTAAPAGYLFCDGAAVSRATYAALFSAIGTIYGVGDGSTTFNVPDLRGRVSAGQDDMGGTSANRLTNQPGGLNGDTLGAAGGSETHTLTVAQMPSHNHSISTSDGSNNSTAGTADVASNADGGATSFAGGGDPHNNVQPTLILNKIIKL